MYRKGIPHVLRRGCHKHDQQVRVGRTQPLRRLNAIGALHADVQKHYLIPFAPAGPQKFISAGKTAAGYVLIFKCLFQQLFQPFGIRLAVFHDRRPQVHSCTPCSFCFPVFYIIAQVPPSVVCHSRTKQPVSRRLRQWAEIFLCFPAAMQNKKGTTQCVMPF